MNNNQRRGATSNTRVGEEFENQIQDYFRRKKKINLEKKLKLKIGISKNKKEHSFDLGNKDKKIIIECKSHKWTEGNNVPSAKMTVWNEAMYLFSLVNSDYEKYFVVLKDYSNKRQKTLGEYYLERYGHLIPEDVEIYEYDEKNDKLLRIEV